MQEECSSLEEELQELRTRYEQYFLGMERQPPNALHDKLKRRLNKLKTAFVRSTVLKFRVQSLGARYLTYERLWVRTLAEMENGTYRRDLFKAKLHQQGARRKSPRWRPRRPAVPPAPPSPPKADPTAPAPSALHRGEGAGHLRRST